MPRISFSTRTICLLACTLLLPPAAFAQPQKPHRAPKQVRQQITDLEEQWRNATLTADIPTMDRLLSDDFVGISWTGQVNTKAEQLDRIRKRTLVITRLELSDVKVKLLGPVAIVTCRSTVEGANDGAPTTGTYRYTRVYQRLPGGVWKITNFEATRVPNRSHDGQHEPPPSTPTPPLR